MFKLFDYQLSNCLIIFSSANLNIHGESPPPKEIPDMSSATFVSVVSSSLISECFLSQWGVIVFEGAFLSYSLFQQTFQYLVFLDHVLLLAKLAQKFSAE